MHTFPRYICTLYTEISYRCTNIDNLFTRNDVENKFPADIHCAELFQRLVIKFKKKEKKIEIEQFPKYIFLYIFYLNEQQFVYKFNSIATLEF